jgi:hypothetical protein
MIHQIYPVKDNKIVIQLPKNLAISQAEVIVLPIVETEPNSLAGKDEVTAVLADFLSLDTFHFTPEEKQAYLLTSQILQQQKAANTVRIAGLFAGLVHSQDDFDAPLTDEDLFWGAGTDAYGMVES